MALVVAQQHGRECRREVDRAQHPRSRGLWRLASLCAVLILVLASCPPAWSEPPPGFDVTRDVWLTAVSPATCRPEDRVETGLQGEVTVEDRVSGRSAQGYNCNIDLVGQYQGQGAGFVSASYKNCAYIAPTWPHTTGLQVIDASDPANPKLTDTLTEPAMMAGTWESLKVNETRGLLAGTGVPFVLGLGYFSIYDISQDCAHPRLLNLGRGSIPGMRIPMLTHEGAFSPDGNTYWASGQMWVSALDVSDPTNPHTVWSAPAGLANHGMDFSPDGTTMYMSTAFGLNILDTTAVQQRAAPDFTMHQLLPLRGDKHWLDGQGQQHSIYTTYRGVPYIFQVGEMGSGGVKLFDASDPANLRLVNVIKLAIDLPGHTDRWASSASSTGFFAYDPHYCSADRRVDPQALACGWTQAGVRVFDVRDPSNIHEIAYYNPPAQADKKPELTNSTHATFENVGSLPLGGTFAVARAILNDQAQASDLTRNGRYVADLTADWCMSPPEFRGNLLFVTCSDNGFMTLRLDPSVYPPR